MKILVVGNRVPWPLHDGGAIATYGMLRSLAENGAEVDFFSFNTKKHFAENAIIEKYFGFCKVHLVSLDAGVKPLKALWNLLFGGSYHLERYDDLEAAVELYGLIQSGNYDCVMAEGLYSMPITLRVMNQLSVKSDGLKTNEINVNSNETIQKKPIKWVYRSHNLEYQIWERLAISTPQPLKRWYLTLQSKRLMRYEIDAWCQMDAIVPIVETDSNVIHSTVAETRKFDQVNSGNSAWRQPQIHVYQPGIAIERPFAFVHQPMSLFHIGSMEWQANEQGVIWFLNKVWPLVLSVQPNAKFHLAGKGLSKQDPRSFQSGIVNHGEVPDAEDFMHQHGVMIVPIQAGSGIRIKTLEAMSLGVPIVSTSVGAQGLAVLDGVEIEIADEPKDFAAAICKLLSSPAKSQEMTIQARKYVELHHNLKRNTTELLTFLASI
jgi:glycosyltransferase involved in cell wall biosynthesis